MNVASEKLHAIAAVAKHEVVRQRFLVAEEVLLDHVRAVSEAEDEILVPEVRIILHQMPHDRPIAECRHRLRNVLVVVAQARAESTGEEDDFHWAATADIVGRSRPAMGQTFNCSRQSLSLRRSAGIVTSSTVSI